MKYFHFVFFFNIIFDIYFLLFIRNFIFVIYVKLKISDET